MTTEAAARSALNSPISNEAKYFAALRAILQAVKKSEGGTVAKVRRIAEEALA